MLKKVNQKKVFKISSHCSVSHNSQ